ncbi:MAG: FAD-binding oxidoreductase [Kiritimatiellae bacterium]|nr:FAD-binding oxidoreductase [Kiritimatiellia bacterium]
MNQADTSLAVAAEGADVADRFAVYLADESRMRGCADRISFPESEAQLAAILKAAQEARTPVTVSGARTGITGGAVPQGGWLVSLVRLDRFLGLSEGPEPGLFTLRCQPGVTLETIDAAVAKAEFPGSDAWPESDRAALAAFRQAGPHLFAPDPTEKTATIGGMVACNASGARTLTFGPTRRHTAALRAVVPGGEILDLRRGRVAAGADGRFRLESTSGRAFEGRLPGYTMPAVKNAAGYYVEPGMDLIDLFIGSEGTLAAFSEIALVLRPAPESILGVIAFLAGEPEALDFVRRARTEGALPVRPLALEYFDPNALALLREQKARLGAGAEIPDPPADAGSAVYIELPTSEADLEEHAMALLELIESCGGDSDTAWTATSEQETERLKAFRHAVPETVNQRIGERAAKHEGLTKLGTDFAVPDNAMEDMIRAYRATIDAAGLQYVIFGHIGNNHVHTNILPRDLDEYRKGKDLYQQLARQAVGFGGTISGEHGVGKLKAYLLPLMYGEAAIDEMRAVKRVFDPEGILNPGNVF